MKESRQVYLYSFLGPPEKLVFIQSLEHCLNYLLVQYILTYIDASKYDCNKIVFLYLINNEYVCNLTTESNNKS